MELTARATRLCARLAHDVSRLRRKPVQVSDLYLGLECGHSDATSGLTANPLAGAIADCLVDAGGTAVVGETIEWLGAEEVLNRA
jgi:altronate dehydratase large subunit